MAFNFENGNITGVYNNHNNKIVSNNIPANNALVENKNYAVGAVKRAGRKNAGRKNNIKLTDRLWDFWVVDLIGVIMVIIEIAVLIANFDAFSAAIVSFVCGAINVVMGIGLVVGIILIVFSSFIRRMRRLTRLF